MQYGIQSIGNGLTIVSKSLILFPRAGGTVRGSIRGPSKLYNIIQRPSAFVSMSECGSSCTTRPFATASLHATLFRALLQEPRTRASTRGSISNWAHTTSAMRDRNAARGVIFTQPDDYVDISRTAHVYYSGAGSRKDPNGRWLKEGKDSSMRFKKSWYNTSIYMKLYGFVYFEVDRADFANLLTQKCRLSR